MKRKKCRKRVKRDLAKVGKPKALRDELRRDWITARCWNCMRCTRFLSKLPPPPGAMAP